jgi:uncharacterized protein (DUF305 family)
MEKKMWVKLAAMTFFGFISMYFLMYSMVNSSQDLFLSINQVWMAGSMAAAMVVIELVIMGEMYKNRAVRYSLILAGIVATVALVLFARYQTFIDDRDFLRSMIPHHSGAILMCANEDLIDVEIRELCREITDNQKREIDQMKAIRARLP